MKIKVLLSDDHNILRNGLRSLIEKQPDMEVVAEAQDGREAVKLARELGPDVIIMDVGMPEMNGIEATRRIHQELPRVRIVALSMHADRRFIVGMLEAGAQAYLLKDCAFDELIRAIRAVLANQTYLSSEITGLVIEDYVRQLSDGPGNRATSPLSNREREVLKLLAEGKTTKAIAAALFVSVKTIETHRSQIMEKLDLHSVAELTKFAIREGLTALES